MGPKSEYSFPRVGSLRILGNLFPVPQATFLKWKIVNFQMKIQSFNFLIWTQRIRWTAFPHVFLLFLLHQDHIWGKKHLEEEGGDSLIFNWFRPRNCFTMKSSSPPSSLSPFCANQWKHVAAFYDLEGGGSREEEVKGINIPSHSITSKAVHSIWEEVSTSHKSLWATEEEEGYTLHIRQPNPILKNLSPCFIVNL